MSIWRTPSTATEYPGSRSALDPFGNSIDTYLALIGEHEAAHVATLSQVIADLGGEPVTEQSYDFGIADAGSFLSTAQALENTGVSAYYGAGTSLQNPDLLTAAGTIVAVEARHAAYLNFLNGEIPFPDDFEATLTPEEVLEIAGPIIAGANGGTPEAVTPEA